MRVGTAHHVKGIVRHFVLHEVLLLSERLKSVMALPSSDSDTFDTRTLLLLMGVVFLFKINNIDCERNFSNVQEPLL
jgi:hypothetical protein